ncbi:MAG: hypothetical protein AB1894_15650 [Chloroflexota bacterium]
MQRFFTCLVLLGLTGLACAGSARPTAAPATQPSAPLATPILPTTSVSSAFIAPPPPQEYQALYAELNAELDAFLATLPGSPGQPPIFSAELMYANGNLGTYLLQAGILETARLALDRLQSLGVQGVGVQISYPLLQPDFPRSDEYLAFYKQIAADVHQHGMTLLVETGPVFPQAEYSGDFGRQVDYSGLTNQEYFDTKRQMLVTIAREIQPDYLALGNEPTTEEMLTGLRFTLQEYFDFVDATLAEIGSADNIKIGAGTGTWEESAYLEHFLQHPDLDFINIHIYPIGQDGRLLEQARQAARRASQAGKDTVIGEAWLYKASHAELGGGLGGNHVEIYSRDAFSFWEPLDEKFMQAVIGMAEAEGIDFVSFFWTRYLLAYLDYDATSSLSTLELSRQVNQAARASLEKGIFSPLGLFYQQQTK